MTAIAVRDGVLAVDSMVSANGVLHGAARKWRRVPLEIGGGFVAACGTLAKAALCLDKFVDNDPVPNFEDDVQMIWLLASGEVLSFETGIWMKFEAPFYALGSAEELMIGAMAAGASAAEAVSIAARYSTTCAAPITILSINAGADA